MKRLLLALPFLMSVLMLPAHAQMPTPFPGTRVIVRKKPAPPERPIQTYQTETAPVRPAPAPVLKPRTAPPRTGSITAVAVPVPPAEVKNPWKLAYSGEWQGPNLSHLDLQKTHDDKGTESYSEIDHSLKLGYGVSKDIVLGTQVRGVSPFDPDKNFFLKNLRVYGSWNNMISTADIDMQTVLDVELPTSDSAQKNSMIVAFNLKNNWTFKTALRNWSFTAQTLIRSAFYDQPGAQDADLELAIYPNAIMDITTDWQLQIDASFDALHNPRDAYFNFSLNSPNYITIGPLYTVNSHIQLYPALRFFTGNLSFRSSVLFFNITAAL